MANATESSVECVPNPDLAGLGVIISFVTAALLTFVMSAACGVLKIRLKTLPKPGTSAEVPRELQLAFSGYAKFTNLFSPRLYHYVQKHNHRDALELGHYVLSQLLLGLGMNQLVSGFALYICTVAKYGLYSQDPHSTLGYSLSSLSMFSQLQISTVLFESEAVDNIAQFRLLIVIYYVLTLSATTFIGVIHTDRDPLADLPGASLGMYGVLFAYLLAASGTTHGRGWTPYAGVPILDPFGWMFSNIAWLRRWVAFFKRRLLLKLSLGFAVCAAFTIFYLVRVLQLKFGETTSNRCNLNTAEKNEWTLGQIFTTLMLIGLLLPAGESYLERLRPSTTEIQPTSSAEDNYQDGVPLAAINQSNNIESLSMQSANNQAVDSAAVSSPNVSQAISTATDEMLSPPSRRLTSRLESQE